VSVLPEHFTKLIVKLLDETIPFSEFIIDQNPGEYNTRILVMLQTIKEGLEKNELPFPRPVIVEFEEIMINFLITWHPKIQTQCRKFYKAYEKMYESNNKLFFNPDDNPLKLIMNNLDSYTNASEVIEKIIKKYDFKSIDEIDFYSFFFAILVTAESMEYYFYTSFSNYLKQYNIPNVDVEEIFSINKTWSEKNGKMISEIRAMRNAIAHFNFKTYYDEDDVNLVITFFPNPQKKEETRVYRSNEIVDFLGEYRYLLQTFEQILFTMCTFKILRFFYSVDSN